MINEINDDRFNIKTTIHLIQINDHVWFFLIFKFFIFNYHTC